MEVLVTPLLEPLEPTEKATLSRVLLGGELWPARLSAIPVPASPDDKLFDEVGKSLEMENPLPESSAVEEEDEPLPGSRETSKDVEETEGPFNKFKDVSGKVEGSNDSLPEGEERPIVPIPEPREVDSWEVLVAVEKTVDSETPEGSENAADIPDSWEALEEAENPLELVGPLPYACEKPDEDEKPVVLLPDPWEAPETAEKPVDIPDPREASEPEEPGDALPDP